MAIPFHEVVASPDVATDFVDASMINRYLGDGSPSGELLYFGFGESWTQVAPGLAELLAQPVPSHVHGYLMSQHGLVSLQRVLRSYIAEDHRLPGDVAPGEHYEVAATSSGTRGAMFDFARMLLADPALEMDVGPRRRPVVIAPTPGWDYAGIVAGIGYSTRFLPLRADAGYQLSADEFDGVVDQVAADPESALALVVVNAQHNPTGQNFDPSAVRHLIRRSFAAGAAVLIDDAYYGVHDPGAVMTSALAILFEELEHAPPTARRRWLAVRSLGKQFHCSGWGIGVATAHPRTLGTMMNRFQLQRGFSTGVPLQLAMAMWLGSPAAKHYLDETNREYAAKRDMVTEVLQTRLGYPASRCFRGVSGAFARIAIPSRHWDTSGGMTEFRQRLLDRTGVLVGVDQWADSKPDDPHFRLYLGPPQEVLAEGLDRLIRSGFHYSGKVVSLAEPL